MELIAGSLIGPYRITGRAGHGGMGVVWKAHDTVLDRPVAIKILHADDERSSEHIVREARLAARLTHPNVVTVYEARREGPSACIVMEWIAGDSLAARIVPGGLGLHAALGYAIAIARALEAAHAAGIIHRDLKPSNVMVPASGEAKLLDFGIAKSLPSGHLMSETLTTATAGVVGTAAYMSPEQVRGQPLDARSDVFSFGAVLYELLTGRRAFDGADTFSTMSAVLTHEPAMPSHAGGERLPDAAVNIVMRCLRKDPSRRFQTAADLRAALEDLAETPRHPLPAISEQRVPRRWIWVAVGAAVAVAIASASFFVSRKSPPRLAAFQQITFDAGIALTPAFSPDGQLLAYASDRAMSGNLDIWLRQVAGGSSARLTTQAGADWNPQFSPDGTRLLYLSGDQNIVEIPVLGGTGHAPRAVANGAGPFSVASTGAIAFVRLPQPSRNGPIFVMAGAGGAPEPWQEDCRSTSRPIWSPDGDQLLFLGECAKSPITFWVAPLKGGARRQLAGTEGLRLTGLAGSVDWFRHRGVDGVLFNRLAGPAREMAWLRLTGELTSLVETSGRLAFAGVSRTGLVVLANEELDYTIWQVPPGSNEPRQVASAIGHYGASRDGRTIVFGRLIARGSGELVLRDLTSGTERAFASHDSITVAVGSIWPQMAPDARQIAYRVVGQNGGHYVLDVVSGETRRLASLDEFQLGSDWSADSRHVLGECPPPSFGICEVDAATGRVATIFRHLTDQLLYPSWSGDGRWVLFGRRKPGQPSSIWAARVDAKRRVAPEAAWVRISTPGADCQRPRLSLDGTAVYYVAGVAGLRHLMRQPVHRQTMMPAGEREVAVPFPLEVMVVTNGFGPYPLITVTERGLFFSTMARRANLFLTELQ